MLAGMGGSFTPPSFLLFLTIQLTSWNFAQKSSAKHSHKIDSKPPKLNRWNLNFKWWFPNFGICSSGSVLGFHVTVASGGCSNEIISQPMEKSFNIQSCLIKVNFSTSVQTKKSKSCNDCESASPNKKKTEKQHWPWHKTNSPVYNFYTAWQLLVYSCKSFWYFLLNLSSKNDANHHESHADWLFRGFLWDSHQIGIKLCTII